MAGNLSRRGFIKGMCTAGALGAMGAAMGTLSGCAGNAGVEEASKTETRFGYCSSCTSLSCAYEATVTDGIVASIEGNPDRVQNLGTLCPRANGLIMYQYNPYRIKAPMKRTNPEKGMDVDPGWVEISWDEALDEAARVLKDVYDTNPNQLIFTYGFADRDYIHNGAAGHSVLAKVLKTKNVSMVKGQFCAMHYASCLTMYDLMDHQGDFIYGKYAVVLGKGFGMQPAFADGYARGFAHYLRNGGKAVFIDPVRNIEGSLADWIPIKPATDCAFVYGLLNTMLFELGNFDIESVKKRTNGPYLIAADGEYVRGASGKPQMWDLASGSAKDFDDPAIADVALEGTFVVDGVEVPTAFTLFKERFIDFTPEWAEKICTIPADTIRSLAKNLIDNAHIGEVIMVDGKEMPYRPSVLIGGRFVCNHEDGMLADLGIRFVNMLLGNLFVPGGANESPGEAPADEDGVIKPFFEGVPCKDVPWPPERFDMGDFMPHRHSTDSVIWQVIAEGPEKWGFEYEPKVLWAAASNSITCTCNPDQAIEAFKKLDYIIYGCCYHMDETAVMADLLLPCHSKLEGMNVTKRTQFPFSSAEPDFGFRMEQYEIRDVIPPQYNTMMGNEIAYEVCKRMGLLPDFISTCNNVSAWGKAIAGTPYELDPSQEYTFAEIYDRYIKNTCGEQYGLDYLSEHGLLDIQSPYKSMYRYYYSPETRTPLYLMSQKHSGEVLLGRMEELGLGDDYVGHSLEYLRQRYDPLPTYVGDENRKLFNAPAEYDMWAFFTRNPRFLYRQGGQDQNPWWRDWSEKHDPEFARVMINTATAEKKGLKDGDLVVIESYNGGSVTARIYATERVHPEALGFSGAIGRKTKTLGEALTRDPMYAELLNGNLEYLEPLTGGTEDTVRVKIKKA